MLNFIKKFLIGFALVFGGLVTLSVVFAIIGVNSEPPSPKAEVTPPKRANIVPSEPVEVLQEGNVETIAQTVVEAPQGDKVHLLIYSYLHFIRGCYRFC